MAINSIMASLYNADLKPLEAGGKTHAYDHASKLFIADNFRLAAKHAALYYVKINVNQEAFNSLTSLIAPDSVSSQSLIEQIETGLLARRADLPKFSIDTKTLNAYNRKSIIQNKINYDAITIDFHDDAANVVTSFWNDYYTYYYRDSDYTLDIYNMQHKYSPRQREGWGYTPRLKNVINFLKSIQIYSLWKKRFTEYTLINPIITNWRHGEHNSYEDATILQNSMTVVFETVKYRTGYINVAELPGFGTIHYDNVKSPISTSTTNIYADAGILGAIDGMSKDLARPDGTGSGRGITGQALDAYRLYNNLKNVNLKNVAGVTLGQIGLGVINGTVNGAVNAVFAPTLSGSPGYGSVYAGSQTYAQQSTAPVSPFANPNNASAVSIAGGAVAAVPGSAYSITQAVSGTSTAAARGITGAVFGPSSYTTQIYQVQQGGQFIQVDPIARQPVTTQITTQIRDPQGQVIGTETTLGTSIGTYDPNNPELNVVTRQTMISSSGETITKRTYRDGTTVDFTTADNGVGQVLAITPGASYVPRTSGAPSGTGYAPQMPGGTFAPVNAGMAAANGQPIPVNQSQFYTDPRTGIVYSTNGVTGQITNTVAGGLGTAAGFTTGSAMRGALNSTGLGKTVVGQIVSTAISTGAGAVVGTLINNTLQPIVNSATGQVVQFYNTATKEIQNSVQSYFKIGGYDPANPGKNIKSVIVDEESGERTYVYFNGDRVNTDSSNNITSVDKSTSVNQYQVSQQKTDVSAATYSTSGAVAIDMQGAVSYPTADNPGVYVDPAYQGGPVSNAYYDDYTGTFVQDPSFMTYESSVPYDFYGDNQIYIEYDGGIDFDIDF